MTEERVTEERVRVVVVGAGFAGLRVARELSRPGVAGRVEVTVVDRNNYNTFQPLLYQVATSGLEASDVAYPARAVFWRRSNVSFRMAEVTGVDWEGHGLLTGTGDRIPFEYLVLACGATANFFGVPGADWGSFPLYTLRDARRLRDHILGCFETAEASRNDVPESLLTFVVVGGGPTGVEVAGALAELLDTALVRDFSDLDRSDVRIVLVEMGGELLAAFGPRARRFALAELRRRGVEVLLETKVASVDGDGATLSTGERVPARTVVWASGVGAPALASGLGVEQVSTGRLCVGEDLRLVDRPEAFAVGDVAAPKRAGGLCPQLAPVAIQSGRHAGRQIARLVNGRSTRPFRYRNKGIMATIGRRAAVTEIPHGPTITGTVGWFAWLALHLVYLIGFRNRVVVLINWAWRYLSWRSGPRLILDPASDAPSSVPTR